MGFSKEKTTSVTLKSAFSQVLNRYVLNPFIDLPVFIFLIILMRLHTYNEPIECDITQFATYAHEMLHGRRLNSDLWPAAACGSYLTYAFGELIAGYGRSCIFFLNILAAILSLFGVYRTGKFLSGRKTTGLMAALLWIALCGDLGLEANQPSLEVFANAALIWLFYLWLKEPLRELDLRNSLLIGSLGTFVSFYKHHFVITAAMLTLAHLLLARRSERKTAFLQAMIVGATGFLGWGLTFLYYFLTGRFRIFFNTLFAYTYHIYSDNLGSKSILSNLISGLSPGKILPDPALFLLPLFIISLVGAAFNARKENRPWVLFSIWVLSTYATIALPGQFFAHYYQLWFPVLALGTAWSLEWIWGRFGRELSLILGMALVVSLGVHETGYYRLNPLECSELKFGDWYIYQEPVSKMINQLLLPEETYYEWDAVPLFYLSSGRRLSVGNIFGTTLFFPGMDEVTRRVIEDLDSKKPEMVVFESTIWRPQDLAVLGKHPVSLYISAHYVPFFAWGPHNRFVFLMRKGGALEKRIAERKAKKEPIL